MCKGTLEDSSPNQVQYHAAKEEESGIGPIPVKVHGLGMTMLF